MKCAWFSSLLSLALMACGGGDDPPAFSFSFSEGDAGASFVVTEAAAVVRVPGSPLSPSALTRLDLYAFESGLSVDACPEVAMSGSGAHVIIEVAELVAGEIPFEGRGAGREGGIPRFDVEWAGRDATGGTINLTSVSGEYAGTFEFEFTEDLVTETITGAFAIPETCVDERR